MINHRRYAAAQDVIRAIRNIRTEKNVKPGKHIPAFIAAAEKADLFRKYANILSSLAHLDQEKLQIVDQLKEIPAGVVTTATSGCGIYLEIADTIDKTAELARLQSELNETQSQIERLEKLLNSPFAEKAPAQVVANEREKLEKYISTAENLKNQIAGM